MKRLPLLAAAAALALALAGAWGWRAHQESERAAAADAAVRDASARLGAALALPPSAVSARELPTLREDVARLAASADALSGLPERYSGAAQYVVGAHEILRTEVEAIRLSAQAAADRGRLAAHMASRRPGEAWIRGALALKTAVERDHFDLDVALKANARLLGTLTAPGVEPALLADPRLLEQARKRALETERAEAAALARARALAGPQ